MSCEKWWCGSTLGQCRKCERRELAWLYLIVVIAVILFVVGCASMPQRDVLRQYQLTRHAFAKTTGEVPTVGIEEIDLVWVYGSLPCAGEPSGYSGCTGKNSKGYYVRVTRGRCVPETSWAHEAVHVFAYDVWGDFDVKHERTELWRGPNSVVRRAQAAGVYEGMCGRY